MDSSLDGIENRLTYLESVLHSQCQLKQEYERSEDISKKFNYISSALKNDRVSSFLKRVDKVQRSMGSSEGEADAIFPDSVKGEIIVAKADEFQQAEGLLTKLEELSPLLNSKPIQDMSSFEGYLNKIMSQHVAHEEHFKDIVKQVFSIVKKYDGLVNNLSNCLEELESKVVRLETMAQKSGTCNLIGSD